MLYLQAEVTKARWGASIKSSLRVLAFRRYLLCSNTIFTVEMTLPGLAVSAFHRIVRSVRLGRGGMVSVSGSAERHVLIRHSSRAFGCRFTVHLSLVDGRLPSAVR